MANIDQLIAGTATDVARWTIANNGVRRRQEDLMKQATSMSLDQVGAEQRAIDDLKRRVAEQARGLDERIQHMTDWLGTLPAVHPARLQGLQDCARQIRVPGGV